MSKLSLSHPGAASDRHAGVPNPVLRPSEYTAALIQALHARAACVRGAQVLEIGCGSGGVLAALAGLGAASLCGVDIESAAVAASVRLLRTFGHGEDAQIHRGDMWAPVIGRRFDLIAANLPHFPMVSGACDGRLPSWSCGGPGGRNLLDRFLTGLSMHLAPRGRAVMTHNAFVGLDPSRALVARSGLSLRIAMTLLVHIPSEKLALMTPGILGAEEGRSIYRYGPYAFAELHIVEIARAESLG